MQRFRTMNLRRPVHCVIAYHGLFKLPAKAVCGFNESEQCPSVRVSYQGILIAALYSAARPFHPFRPHPITRSI